MQDATRILVPSFQRGVVWEDDKKRELISSIHRGFPIGVLLLSDKGTKDGIHEFALIDGLQRTNAIVDYLERPLELVGAEVLPQKDLELLNQGLQGVFGIPPIDSANLTESLIAWMRRTRVLESAKGFEWDALLESVLSSHGLPEPKPAQRAELRGLLTGMVDRIRTAVSIEDYQVQVLIHSGPQEQLPEIFERLNTQGTKLTKYEVYAASWVDVEVSTDNDRIREAVNQKYEDLERHGFIVDRDPTRKSVTLFEYLFGLSRVLAKDFPALFGAPDAIDASVAFALATLIRGRQLSAMGDLPDFVGPRGDEKRIETKRLEDAILFAAGFVADVLAPFIGLRLTKEPSGPAHADLQVDSMIAAVAAHRYDSPGNFALRPGWANTEAKLRHAMPQHYLLDIIREAWRGPTYSLAYQRTWKQEGVPSDDYLTAPSRAIWDAALGLWFDEQSAKQNEKRPNVTAAEKTLLKFVYSSLVSVKDQNKYEFDIDHLYPVNRILEVVKRLGGAGWPIGCIANVGLLPRSVNRRKRDETVAEYLARDTASGGPKDEEREVVQKFLLCAPGDVSIEKALGVDVLPRAKFDAFLSTRWVKIRSALYKTLGVGE